MSMQYEPVAVFLQKNLHDKGADAFVVIDESVIDDKTIADSGDFFNSTWKQFFSLERLERSRYGGSQGSGIAYTACTIRLLNDFPVQRQNLFDGEPSHLAILS